MWSLHCHSEYSNAALGFADTINKLEELIKKAKEIGLSGIAITDHECLSGHYQAQKLSKKYEILVALGNEIYLQTPDEYNDAKNNYKSGTTYYPHFVLIAKDEVGHYQLRQLSSIAWRDNSYWASGILRRPTKTTDIENVIGNDKGHLIASTACLGSFFAHKVLELIDKEKMQNEEIIYDIKLEIDTFIEWCINTFGKDNFFIEIQPATIENNEQWLYNQRAIKIAKAYGLNFIITTDAHYLQKEDKEIHKSFLNSKDAEREVDDFYATAYLMNEQEVRSYLNENISLEDINCALETTNNIGGMIKEYSLSHTQIIPLIDVPNFKLQHSFKDYYAQYTYIKNFAYSERIQDQYLLYRIEHTLFTKISEEDIELAIKRIDDELKELWLISDTLNQPIGGYYNTFSKIIEIVWTEGNSLVCPNRGSTGVLFIAYLLGITQINPLPMGKLMPHWRHISAERGYDLPDIDFDTEAAKRKQIIQAVKNYFGENKVLNVCTFGTLSAKTAIQVAGRGLGYINEDVETISDLIPIERGEVYSLNDCLNGNPDKNRLPVKEFINTINEYPDVLKVALKIEGLIVQRGVHASGVIISNDDYTLRNACMLSPSGDITTQFDLHDSEGMGGLKYDFLTISALDRIRKNLDMLVEDGYIQWQGSLKATYDKYLHPDVINYDNQEMWSKIAHIPSLFQFETNVGSEAVKFVKPTNINELAVANSLMRLMNDGNESPLEQFVRYKKDINNWYSDMKEYGLNDEEIEILKSHLADSYGLADSQEKVMILSMDSKISNFSLKDANKLRKSIAKKKFDILQETKQMFYEKGKEVGTREVFLQYVWEVVFAKSFGYSFSYPHAYGYSVIALQEMNLYHYYPSIYWNTACLIVNSGSDEDNENNKGTNYGKVATAIGNMQSQGVKILPPDINQSRFGFSVDIINNSIIFGLKGISNIGDEAAFIIIQNRPYSSLFDFINKTNFGKVAVINLIKGGCFDNIENKNRKQIMKDYFMYLAEKENPKKSSLTLQNLGKIQELNILAEEDVIYIRLYNFNKYVTDKQFLVEKRKNKSYYIAKDKAFPFFQEYYAPYLKEGVDYEFTNDGIVFCKASYDKLYKQHINEFVNILNSKYIDKFNTTIINHFIEENWNKYCKGTISTWEMDALSFYYHDHELKNVDIEKYNISNFFDIPKQPIVEGEIKRKGKTFPKYRLYKIVGTVLDKDKIKHTISLLTTDGVVTVKFYAGQYIHYSKNISEINNETGKKNIVEKAWFDRGNLLMISGIRREGKFYPKKYMDSVFSHTVCLIEDVVNNGRDLVLKLEREYVE